MTPKREDRLTRGHLKMAEMGSDQEIQAPAIPIPRTKNCFRVIEPMR